MITFQAKQECQILCPCGAATDREILWSHAQLLHSRGNGSFDGRSVNHQGEGVCGKSLLQACQLVEAKEVSLWSRCTPGSEVSSDPDQGRRCQIAGKVKARLRPHLHVDFLQQRCLRFGEDHSQSTTRKVPPASGNSHQDLYFTEVHL